MTQMIEIEGDLARVVERNVITQVALADLMPNIETRLPTITPALPDKTKLIAFDPSDNDNWKFSVLIELPPLVRTLTMAEGIGRARDGAQHRLAIPWTIFVFHLSSQDRGRRWTFEDYSCYFSKVPVTTGDEILIPALLPNIFEHGRICFGNTAPAVGDGAGFATRLNAVVNEFYLSRFTDEGHTRVRYLPYNADRRNYEPWETATEENPRCWETWPEFNRDFTDQQHFTARECLLRESTERITPIVLANGVPELPHTITFGRAHEWLGDLTDTQRRRLATELHRGWPDLLPLEAADDPNG